MKVLAINSVPYGSTGRIMMQVLDSAEETLGANTIGYFGAWKENKSIHPNLHQFGCYFENRISFILSYFSGYHNVGSVVNTLKLLEIIRSYNPDVIHLHNLHLWIINLPILFDYLKKSRIKVIWTLHDCWAFTGQCTYFTMTDCDKWKVGCHHCPSFHDYPNAFLDRTKLMYKLKKKWFCGVNDLTIVTPSQWLADLVKQSFLKDYPIKVINNGIDLSIFKPTDSDFRKKFNCEDKYILLGVSFGWGKRKGLDVFIELAKRLERDYQIVLVGTNALRDQELPDNIVSIHRTDNQIELAEIYTAADLFVNPTREEVFGLVNVEALACGTPVLTFQTGGSPECIDSECGTVVRCDDIDGMEQEIRRIRTQHSYKEESCISRARLFTRDNMNMKYIELYSDQIHEQI